MNSFSKSSLVVWVLVICGCDNTATKVADDSALLQSASTSVGLPAHDTFSQTAAALDAAVATLDSNPTTDAVTAAQTAWRAARAAYRTLDPLHFGPVADDGIDVRIDYSKANAPANTTAIEALVQSAKTLDASTIADAGGGEKGFLGLEYLLFSAPTGDAMAARRWHLAHLMADEIAQSAKQPDDAWQGATGFAAQISTAGGSSTVYPTQRAAVNNLVGGVSYALEIIVGLRLAYPLGRKAGGTPDGKLDPTLASDSAQADMIASLNGTLALYNAPHGYAESIRAHSAALETKTTSQFADCSSALAAIPKPFGSSVTSNTAAVQAAYDACKALKTTWNTDVASALGASFVSDTDGD